MSIEENENPPPKNRKDRWAFTLFPKDATPQQISDHLKKIRDQAVAEKNKKP